MAGESKFPGNNPFSGAGAPGFAAGARGSTGGAGMHSLQEEEEADPVSQPRQPSTIGGHPLSGGDDGGREGGAAAFSQFKGFSAAAGTGGASEQAQAEAGSAAAGTGRSPAAAAAAAAGAAAAATAPPPSLSTFPHSAAGLEAQGLPSNYNMNRRTSVSAESLNPSAGEGGDGEWTAPQHAKTAEQQARLRAAVAHNFLFSHLDEEQSSQVLGALQEKPVPARGIKVIVQGDVGDYFYVVEAGSFDIFVSPTGRLESGAGGAGACVGTVGAGGSFGELALMYNAPRAATVVSTAASTLWALDRVTFRRILMDSAFQRRRMYEAFLDSVPLLTSLTAYERSKISDALETHRYPAGTTIIRQGDPGESFFILESGQAEVYKHGLNDGRPLLTYQKGDYFGELALLNDAPRAATVVSTTDVKLATLGKDGFQRLLGPVEGIMRRNDPSKAPLPAP